MSCALHYSTQSFIIVDETNAMGEACGYMPTDSVSRSQRSINKMRNRQKECERNLWTTIANTKLQNILGVPSYEALPRLSHSVRLNDLFMFQTKIQLFI